MTEKLKNPNHPPKGSQIRVEPIKRLEDIELIKKTLAGNPRDLLLFVLGINNGLRAGDLLQLKVKDIRGLKPGEFIHIRESKTGKLNILMINKAVFKVLKHYLERLQPTDDDYLFVSRKTKKPLTIPTVNVMVKEWCRSAKLNSGNYGAHTLRKTFGYQQRVRYGVGFEILAKRFNHSSPAVTMRYLGLSSEEVNSVLMNEI